MRPSREGTKCIIFLPILEREGKSRNNQWFSSPRHRRAHAAHLQERIPLHGFGEGSFARRIRRGEKGAPLRDAREPNRLRAWPNTQNRGKVLRFRTRNSHHLPRIITTRPPFSPNRRRKRCKGCHFAKAANGGRAQTTTPRQEASLASPLEKCQPFHKPGPGAGGAGIWAWPSPLPLLCRSRRAHRAQTNDPLSTKAHPTPAPGGGGLPLPAAAAAAPFKTMKPKEHRAKTPKCLIFPPTDERAGKTIKNQ